MKSQIEFDAFYNRELKKSIEQLEAKRMAIGEKFSYKRYKRNLKWAAIVCGALLIAGAILPSVIPPQVSFCIPATALYAIFAPLYIFIRRNIAFGPVGEEYKKTVIPKIISFIAPEFNYKPGEGISRDEFNSSDLFDRPSTFKSEDLVYGKTESLEIKMSDIICSKRTGSKNGKGTHVTIFAGFYSISRGNKNVPSRVQIYPAGTVGNAVEDFARKLFGSALTDTLAQKLNSKMTKSGDEEFDRIFTVYCQDHAIAKNFLTPQLLQLIMAFKKEFEVSVYFSFFDDQAHIAFSGVNMFEADAHTSFVEKDISKEYFKYLNLTVGIAEALQSGN